MLDTFDAHFVVSFYPESNFLSAAQQTLTFVGNPLSSATVKTVSLYCCFVSWPDRWRCASDRFVQTNSESERYVCRQSALSVWVWTSWFLLSNTTQLKGLLCWLEKSMDDDRSMLVHNLLRNVMKHSACAPFYLYIHYSQLLLSGNRCEKECSQVLYISIIRKSGGHSKVLRWMDNFFPVMVSLRCPLLLLANDKQNDNCHQFYY